MALTQQTKNHGVNSIPELMGNFNSGIAYLNKNGIDKFGVCYKKMISTN